MNVTETNKPAVTEKQTSRKKFLLWGGAILSTVLASKFIFRSKRKTTGETKVKMLTQDGKLVEIDRKFISPAAKKITDKELQSWVKK